MKVLLFHEMSGVHTELKKGLMSIGIETHIATHGDTFKKYSSDINLGSISGSLASHLDRLKCQFLLAKKFGKYDVVQVISPDPFYKPVSSIFNAVLANSDCKKIYIAAGSDAIYRKHVRELEYYPPHPWYDDSNKYYSLKKRLEKFDNIIPVCWEYKYAMEQAGFSPSPVIPFPIDLQQFKPKPRQGRKKIVFFHPLNRVNLEYDFKGTLIIQDAFKILTEKYSDVAEFICKGNMTHQEYDAFTDNVDVIVDQLYSYSYGMSAALGLAKGKVVISGLEQGIDVEHFKECPIINSKPNVADLVRNIEILILDKSAVNRMQIESRFYAEKYHCSTKVAEQFAKIYTEF